MRKLSITLLSILTLTSSNPLRSQETKAPLRPSSRESARLDLLDKFDRNDNGKLDPVEIEEVARNRYLKWDSDGSGKVDSTERKVLRDRTSTEPTQDKATRMAALARALEAARIKAESDKKRNQN